MDTLLDINCYICNKNVECDCDRTGLKIRTNRTSTIYD